mgnify:CR=1 FL=1
MIAARRTLIALLGLIGLAACAAAAVSKATKQHAPDPLMRASPHARSQSRCRATSG